MFGKRTAQMQEAIQLLRTIRDNTTPMPLQPVMQTAKIGKTKKSKKGKNLFSKKERKAIKKIANNEASKVSAGAHDDALEAAMDARELSEETALLAKDIYEIAHALVNLYGVCAAMLDVSRMTYSKLSGGEVEKFDRLFQDAMEKFDVKPELVSEVLNDSAIAQDIINMRDIDREYIIRQAQMTPDGHWWIDPASHPGEYPTMPTDEDDDDDDEDDDD